jgi:hypothetical protein
MMEEEEKAREYFEETKDILKLFCPCVWMDGFQECVEDFVRQHLSAAEIITTVPTHGRRRLCLSSWAMLLGSWGYSRRRPGMAVYICHHLCQVGPSTCLGWTRVCDSHTLILP